MRHVIYSLFLISGLLFSHSAQACYANFTHTNACAGDTVWFNALDLYSIHAWDFGDTISGNPNISHDSITYHVYTQPGTYYVTHFNNIGAEWAYETQVIVIGNDCFEASFEASCSGYAYYQYFENQSIGNNLTYSWNFGDPASGTADTSSQVSPTHQYPQTGGVYTVTLTISDGTQTDSYTQTITVGTSCANVSIYSPYILPCVGDSVTLSCSANPGSYPVIIWNFGDPASGASNLATNVQSPVHVFSSTGLYTVSCIVSNGTVLDTAYSYVYVSDCRVWPGDANFDGKVSAEDLLPIGIYYGTTGTARTNPTSAFSPQIAEDWVTPGMPFMYLDDILNFKYADCNGDGIINQGDADVVLSNFGNSSFNNNTTSFMIPQPTDPEFSLNADCASCPAGDWITVTATLGTVNVPANGMYGFTTAVEYNPELILSDSVIADFSASWFGNSQDVLTLFYNDKVNHVLHFGIVKRDSVFVPSGFGEIFNFHFKTKGNAPSGNYTLLPSVSTKLITNRFGFGGFASVANYRDVHLTGSAFNVSGSNAIVPASSLRTVKLFPNFAHDFVTIAGEYPIDELLISDIHGKLLGEYKPGTMNFTFSVEAFSSGVYFVSVKTNGKLESGKLYVNR